MTIGRKSARWLGAAVLVLTPLLVLATCGAVDEMRLRIVRETFVGLDRQAAYSRLRAMGILAQPVAAYYRDGTPMIDRGSWPQKGDVAVEFWHALRTGAQGACGGHAVVAIHFGSGNRVAKVTETTLSLACM